MSSEAFSVQTFRPEWAEVFRELNLQWIRRFFEVEPNDVEQLSDPASLVARGGQVLFVVRDGRPVGCCALIPTGPGSFELAKMAVDPASQGLGLGHRILEGAEDWARRQGARELHLLSNTRLGPALHLYQAHGYRTTRRGPHPLYRRTDIEMRLDLDPGAGDARDPEGPPRGLNDGDLAGFDVITFDCYGTLIDWETGILGALKPVLDAHGIRLEDAALLEIYARAESDLEAGPYQPYREVLAQATRRVARDLGFTPTEEDCVALATSLPRWPCFSDTVAALEILAAHARLALLSNIDDDLLAPSRATLGCPLAWWITAQQVRGYKPGTSHFEAAIDRIGASRERWLHVAQSLYHDIRPARSLGIRTVWVNRRGAQPGSGATPVAAAQADMEVPDLRTLADMVAQARKGRTVTP